jgi:hypothetical protein
MTSRMCSTIFCRRFDGTIPSMHSTDLTSQGHWLTAWVPVLCYVVRDPHWATYRWRYVVTKHISRCSFDPFLTGIGISS